MEVFSCLEEDFPNRKEVVALGAWCEDCEKQTRKALPGHLEGERKV